MQIADVGLERLRIASNPSSPVFLLQFEFFRRHVCTHRRSHAAPEGYTFLRNYKRLHRDRIEEALHQAELTRHAIIAEEAYDCSGRRLPDKVAVYVNREDAGGLFFQFYAHAKAQRRRATRSAVA